MSGNRHALLNTYQDLQYQLTSSWAKPRLKGNESPLEIPQWRWLKGCPWFGFMALFDANGSNKYL